MLTRIDVRDFAIVSALELEFTAGMTVLTGETGAGKSILIEALGLALGDRADTGAVRTGAERAEVTAVFDLDTVPAARAWLDAQGIASDGECLLRRVVVRDGRSRAYVNGTPVPVQSLQALGGHLLDIHGQHAHQSLLHRASQRDLLDAYGGHRELAAQVAQAWRHWQGLLGEQAAAAGAAADRTARLELLTYQVAELAGLALADDELPRLAEEQQRLANAGSLMDGAARLLALLHEDDEAVEAQLGRAIHQLDALAGLDPAIGPARELLDAALIQLKEAAGVLRAYRDHLDLDPERLDEVDRRLAAVQEMARKHRVRPEELPERLQALESELAALRAADARSADLDAAIEGARAAFRTAAGRLSAIRREAAGRLATAVTEHMQTLGMAGGVFRVDVHPLGDEQAGAFGLDRIDYLVAANPGQPPAPLAKVASGGELSRISLAVQVATAGLGAVPTLVFDEVDVGIGGGVAEVVGRLLRDLGRERQVLCVTHLPQVASQADHHFAVRKQSRRGQVETTIEQVAGAARVEEIARMAGGVQITDQALAHAAALIDRSGATAEQKPGATRPSAGAGSRGAGTRRK
jgi:DNA repair protein RecN (Recombination protein N)